MKKKQVIIDVDDYKKFYIDYKRGDKPVKIKEIFNLLKNAEKNGATHIKIVGGGLDGQMDYIDVQPVTVAVESDESFNKRVNEKLSEESDNENEKIIELIKQRDEIERQVNELDDMALIKYELKRLKRKVKDELKRL